MQITLTVAQVDSLSAQFIAAHGEQEWMANTYYHDGVLTVSEPIAEKVAAFDYDAAFVPVPDSVTQVQMRTYLITAGLLDVVTAALATDQTTQGRINLATFEYASVIQRAHPLITAMGATIGMTPEQLDAAFVAASQF